MYICHFPISNWIFDKIMIHIISIQSFINAPLLVIEIIGVGIFIPPRHADDTKYPGSDRVKHILSRCSVSLQQGRYRWRHDQTLAVIAHHLELSLNTQRGRKTTNNTINFVKAGQHKPVLDVGIIHTTNDWQMLVDLRRKLVIPPDIAVTTLRPDIVIISRSSSNILIAVRVNSTLRR